MKIRNTLFALEALGERFVAGAVFYLGEQALPFGGIPYALPISVLWQADA